jgi:RNA polymerase sigma-70 factor (sigma-E family)
MPASRVAEERRAQERGSPSKLDELYRANAPGALRLAYLLTGNRDAANDLVQEAFVRVAARFRHLRDRNSFEPYLRRTMVNLAKSGFRRASLERRFIARFRDPKPRSTTPEIDTRHDLWQLLLRLPARQRIALVLRFYEDMSELETAEVLGTSARAVNALVSRGLDQLRRSGGQEEWID